MWFIKWLQGFRLYFLLPSLALLALSACLLFFAHRFWPWGWAVGIVLFFFSPKSSSEKKGYRF